MNKTEYLWKFNKTTMNDWLQFHGTISKFGYTAQHICPENKIKQGNI